MKKIIIFPLLCIVAFLIAFACKKSDTTANPYSSSSSSSGSPGANEVWMQSNMFNPMSLTVPVNTTVKWTNKDGVTHTVTSNSGEFNSGNIGSGGTYSFTFTKAGSFPYRCTIHSNMTGTVTVQ